MQWPSPAYALLKNKQTNILLLQYEKHFLSALIICSRSSSCWIVSSSHGLGPRSMSPADSGRAAFSIGSRWGPPAERGNLLREMSKIGFYFYIRSIFEWVWIRMNSRTNGCFTRRVNEALMHRVREVFWWLLQFTL